MKALKSKKAKQMDPDEININLIDEFRKDNLTLIRERYQDKFNKLYADKRTGQIYKFIGIVIADDDYYYGLMNMNDKTWVLSSCVGYLEKSGYEEVVK